MVWIQVQTHPFIYRARDDETNENPSNDLCFAPRVLHALLSVLDNRECNTSGNDTNPSFVQTALNPGWGQSGCERLNGAKPTDICGIRTTYIRCTLQRTKYFEVYDLVMFVL